MSRSEKQPREDQPSFVESVVTGSVAGTSIACLTYPAEGWKKHLQTKQQGRFAPYRGLLGFLLNITPTTTIQLTTDSMLQRHMPDDPSLVHQLAASIFCGTMGALTATPVENSIVRQQMLGSGLKAAVSDMLNHSPTRPWKTFPLIALRDAIFTSWMLTGAPAANRVSQQYLDPRYAWIVNAAGALVATGLSQPADTIASNIQKYHHRIPAHHVAKELYKAGGVAAFYRGFLPRAFMVFWFSNGIPLFKETADHLLYGRKESRAIGFFKESKDKMAEMVPPCFSGVKR